MDRKTSTEISRKKGGSIRFITQEDSFLPPWLFQNKDLTDVFKSADTIEKEALINTLNHIHFMDGYVLVHLRHPKYDESILVKAHPEPCLDTKLICHLSEEKLSGLDLSNFQFLHLLIDDGKSMILVPAELQEMDKNRFVVKLPQKSYTVGQRQERRYACSEIDVELIQAGLLTKGELLDFSPNGLRIRMKQVSSCFLDWFNTDALTTVNLRRDQQILLSGSCQCIRQLSRNTDNEVVLAPVGEKTPRSETDQIRNPRQCLVPSPKLTFDHPILRKRVQFDVLDISTSGFSIYEKADEGVLIPGMVIPKLTIDFAALVMECAAQVIYRIKEDEKTFRIGLAILDMDINNYSRMAGMLTNALDPYAHVSKEVDMDDLWEFFFESGFIYPTKYHLIKSYREDFKKTYRKLYQESPEIARYFTYQKNGRIYGHISMLKAYERTWMIQHHAARAMNSKWPGFMVIKQIMYYLNDMYRLPSAKTNYLMCYFRPESKFPDRVFGGFARSLNNPKGCSIDLFSYLPYPTLSLGARLPEGWSLQKCSRLDLWELSRFYNHHSGGLLLDILSLEDKDSSDESFEDLYKRFDFMRRWKAYSLTHYNELNAVLIVDQSDLGLNLSELLNGIKILVTNQDDLPWDILSITIGQLVSLYNMDKVPVLIYPFEYVEAKGIPYEKQYYLWIYDAHFVGRFKEFLQRKFRINYWK